MSPPAPLNPPFDERASGYARRIAPALLALTAQVAAGAAVALGNLAWNAPGAAAEATVTAVPLIHGSLAALFGHWLRLPAWWLPINFAFVPAALLVSDLELAPAWFLAMFVMLALLFQSTFRGRVPLYASSREACSKLTQLLPARSGLRVLDLGCGAGGVLQHLRRARPDALYTGLELAPLPALLAWLRLRRFDNCRVRRSDFWRADWSSYDVVYAFLSPVAMPDLWRKASVEMKRGSLLVSNSFAIEGVAPHAVVALSGRASDALLVWRI
jgi:SAM-dependent methyltransferase